MPNIALRIASSIITAGIFLIVVFLAASFAQLGPWLYVITGLLLIFIFVFGYYIGEKIAHPFQQILEESQKFQPMEIDTILIEKTSDIKAASKVQVLEEAVLALEQKIASRTFELEKALEQSNFLILESREKDLKLAKLEKKIKPKTAKGKTKKAKQ